MFPLSLLVESEDEDELVVEVYEVEVEVEVGCLGLSYCKFLGASAGFWAVAGLSEVAGVFIFEEDDEGFLVNDDEAGGAWAGGVDAAGAEEVWACWLESLGFESVEVEVEGELSYVLKRLLKSILLPLLLPE